jgi:hypothetical protein
MHPTSRERSRRRGGAAGPRGRGRERSSSREGERRKTHLPGDKFAERERAAQPRAPSRAVPTRWRDERSERRHTSRLPGGGGLRNPPQRWISRPIPHAPPRPAALPQRTPNSQRNAPNFASPRCPVDHQRRQPKKSAATRHRGELPQALKVGARRRHRGKAKPVAPRGASGRPPREGCVERVACQATYSTHPDHRAPVAARGRRPARTRQRPVEPAGQRLRTHHSRRGSMAEHLRPSTARPGHQAKTKPGDATSDARRRSAARATRAARQPRRRAAPPPCDWAGPGARSTESGPPTRSRPANG